MPVYKFFRTRPESSSRQTQLVKATRTQLGIAVSLIVAEWCFYIETSEALLADEKERLRWLLAETFDPDGFSQDTFLSGMPTVLEVGPRLNFVTAWSSTAVAICHACGLTKVNRLERSSRFGLDAKLNDAQAEAFLAPLHDRMTQMRYLSPLSSFVTELTPQQTYVVYLEGLDWRDALREHSRRSGFGWDEQDLVFIGYLFRDVLRRNPTDVELFQLAQANSEHSRHWRFRGRLEIDGVTLPYTLMDMIKTPWRTHPGISLRAFCDDSSALRGGPVELLWRQNPLRPGPLNLTLRLVHPTLTAETHNHPSFIEPFEGAATGIGGDLRDVFSIGRGGLCGMSGAGYGVGALCIPGHDLPWEQDAWPSPTHGASPLEILMRGSDGVSAYANCFGEPLGHGFVRSFAMQLSDGYRAYVKPILYVSGAGSVDEAHLIKGEPVEDMLVVQIGGPGFRIGVGGGSASSMVSGANIAALDFASVQRGDAEMEQRVYRLVQACIEMGEANPIVSIHDLGAGGDCNALPEIVEPQGAIISVRALPCGDASLSVLEIWGNESQEREVLLIHPKHLGTLHAIARREGVPLAVVGQVTGDGLLILHDETHGSTPVNLPLDRILGQLPPKTFQDRRVTRRLDPLILPVDLPVREALRLVLSHPSVGSREHLTRKVDRSVRGLLTQQPCVGPNHLPLADCAIRAESYFSSRGSAHSLGEQPVKGLLSPQAMARLVIAEALLNMCGAVITSLSDVRGSANWMLAAREPGETAWLYDAVEALVQICLRLGIAPDGGKDSLSMAVTMAAPDGQRTLVKAPGTLVLSAYAPMTDVTQRVTPDLKQAGSGLILVDLSQGKNRLGGSILGQILNQLGDQCPDVDDVDLLKRAFEAIQLLVASQSILSLHDRSDGGLITTLLEMAFAGNLGLDLAVTSSSTLFETLFSEEPGVVIECADPSVVLDLLNGLDIPAAKIGNVSPQNQISLSFNGQDVLTERMTVLRREWESTSDAIERLQVDPSCAESEREACGDLLQQPAYRVSFEPRQTMARLLQSAHKPKVAIVREEGSNGDREMAAAFFAAGFEPWDVTMKDLLAGNVSLEEFRGLALVGGFSFADVFDAGKGWAGVVRFNERIREQFDRFRLRPDTFSLGICNGCQLMALLGWIPGLDLPDEQQPRFVKNASGRFESRFSILRIGPSPSILLRNMEDSVLGCWVAHGEGRLHASEEMIRLIREKTLAPIRYADPQGEPTTVYPFNPNGSPHGIAGLCSMDGRHLALMPHPERTFQLRQWPWLPRDWNGLEVSPWLRLFQNAYNWCVTRS